MELIKKLGSASNPQNADKYVNAYLRLFNNAENLKFLSFTGIPFTRRVVEDWLREADASNVEYHTASGSDGEICAIMATVANPVEGFEIMAVVVDETCRRSGIGGRLLKTAEGRAGELGFRSISAMTFADNKRMLSLLIKNDYKPYKLESCKRWDGEGAVYLKKYLQ